MNTMFNLKAATTLTWVRPQLLTEVMLATALCLITTVVLKAVVLLLGTIRAPGALYAVAVVLGANHSGLICGLLTAALSAFILYFLVVPVAGDDIVAAEIFVNFASLSSIAVAVTKIGGKTLLSYNPGYISRWLKHVETTSTGRSFWCVTPSGSYIKDCQSGVQLARETLVHVESRGGAYVLVYTLADMVRQGRYSGVEAGFVSELARRLASEETKLSVADDNPDDGRMAGGIVHSEGYIVPLPVRDEEPRSYKLA